MLEQDIGRIVANKNMYLHYDYQIILHSVDFDYEFNMVRTLEYMQDYNSGITDYILLTVNLPLGTFIKKIYPNRDHLTCTIIKRYKYKQVKREINNYKAVILPQPNTDIDNSGKYDKLNEITLNKAGQLDVEFQLYYLVIDGLTNYYVDGVYKNTTVSNLLGALFHTAKQDIKVNGLPLDYELDIYKIPNDQNYSHLVIPTGTKLIELPSYLQYTDYGVYNGGCGIYVQSYQNKNYLYIYPIYSATRFNTETKDKLVIYNVAHGQYNLVENTYLLNNGIISILVNSSIKSLNNSVNEIINTGNEILSSKPNKLLENGDITDDSFTVDQSSNLTSDKHLNRKDSISKSTYVANESNLFKHRTDLLRKTMAFYQLTWHYSNRSLVYPGMPVCFITQKDISNKSLKTVKMYGTVQNLVSRYDGAKKTTSSIILIAVSTELIDYC